MATHVATVTCPFCSVTYEQEWSQMLTLHIQEQHAERSDFSEVESVPEDSEHASAPASQDSRNSSEIWVACTEPECEEHVLLADLSEHLDLHEATNAVTLDDMSDISSRSSHRRHKTISGRARTTSSHQDTLGSDNLHRVSLRRKAATSSTGGKGSAGSWSRPARSSASGSPRKKSDSVALGPFADEKRMPRDLYEKLKAGPRIMRQQTIGPDGRLKTIEQLEGYTSGLVSKLAELSAADPSVEEAWFCHPSVQHIHNLRGQGGFCGYRNVQMQMSYIQSAKMKAAGVLPKHAPTVIEMQDWIERAWDEGINDIGRAEVGVLKGTRKWIGTSEASAIYSYLGIPHDVWQCSDEPNQRAHRVLFHQVREYFEQDGRADTDTTIKVHRTALPPIYLQQPGHSLTVVGFEKHNNGHSNLIVFDCMYEVPRVLISPRNLTKSRELPIKALEVFRRDGKRLHRYKEFELLQLGLD